MLGNFDFLDKYLNPEMAKKNFIIYDSSGKAGTKCGGVKWKHVKSDDSGSWIFFSREKATTKIQCDSGLKMHIAIASDDLEKALDIISQTTKEHNIACFKMLARPHSKHSVQVGKEFCVYFGHNDDSPQKIQAYVNALEKRLSEAGIKPGAVGINLRCGNRRVNGSKYLFYRYENESDKTKFKIPQTGDVMKDVFIHGANIEKNELRWYNPTQWRDVKDEKENDLTSFDYFDKLNPAEQHNLLKFLKENHFYPTFLDVHHRDNTTSIAVAVSDPTERLPQTLAYKEIFMEQLAEKVKNTHWSNESVWIPHENTMLLDNTDLMETAQRNELEAFLNKSGINYKPVNLIQPDETKSSGIQVFEPQQSFLIKLRQFAAQRKELSQYVKKFKMIPLTTVIKEPR